jgi:hypothetical protein
MASTLPLDILHKVERRWSARTRQAGSFPAEADRLKQGGTTFIEGVQPQTDRRSRIDEPEVTPLPPNLPTDEH